MEVLATGYHLSAMKLKHVLVCPTCMNRAKTSFHAAVDEIR